MMRESSRAGEVIGAVLAGGTSRRMGRDKALMVWSGRTLLEHAIGVLLACFAEVVVVAPERVGYGELGVRVLPDLRPGLGPVGGIHTALVHGAGRDVFVLACDLPQIGPELVSWIIGGDTRGGEETSERSIGGRVGARILCDGGGAQPLCGLYSSRCLRAVESALDQSALSARDLVSSLDADLLDVREAPKGIRVDRLFNLNTPGELGEWTASEEVEG